MRHFLLSLLLLIPLVTSCGNPETPTSISTATIPPTLISTSTPVPQSATATPLPIPPRPAYTLDTTFDYDLHIVSVDQTIIYPNHSGQPLDALVFAVAPNYWPNCFFLQDIAVDNVPAANYQLNAHRLDVPLPTPLLPDSAATVTLRFKLSLPYLDQANSLRARIFGYGDVQTNLVNWYPYVVPFEDGEWIIREPWSHGEYLAYPSADFEVNLNFANPENKPIVAASGYAELNGDSTRYTLTEGRAFAISASREFQVSSMQAGDAVVYSYYLPIYQQAGWAAMHASAEALQVFSQRFGSYPHKTLSIVIADFKDSMEFSALYFHSRSFYDLYNGTPGDYLTFVAVHETGHQWWFDQVANDQALEPWLDESLTTYSEAIYYESVHPDLLPLWWSNRINFFEPKGYIDIPVNEGLNDDNYKHTVYFNGAKFLHELRQRIGDEAFFAFLQDYYQQSRGHVVSADDFFRILDEHTDMDYSDILQTYFRNQ